MEEKIGKVEDESKKKAEEIGKVKVNISDLTKAVEKLQTDVVKLKDKQREFANGNSH